MDEAGKITKIIMTDFIVKQTISDNFKILQMTLINGKMSPKRRNKVYCPPSLMHSASPRSGTESISPRTDLKLSETEASLCLLELVDSLTHLTGEVMSDDMSDVEYFDQ